MENNGLQENNIKYQIYFDTWYNFFLKVLYKNKNYTHGDLESILKQEFKRSVMTHLSVGDYMRDYKKVDFSVENVTQCNGGLVDCSVRVINNSYWLVDMKSDIEDLFLSLYQKARTAAVEEIENQRKKQNTIYELSDISFNDIKKIIF
jgi:hypothetical protein